jgi:hypothetical protein
MALLRQSDAYWKRPLLGAKPTYRGNALAAAFDPKRTLLISYQMASSLGPLKCMVGYIAPQ